VRTRTRLDAQIARGTADSCHCTDATRRDATRRRRRHRRRRRKVLSFPASSFVLVELRPPVLSNYDGETSPAFSPISAHAVRNGAMTRISLSLSLSLSLTPLIAQGTFFSPLIISALRATNLLLVIALVNKVSREHDHSFYQLNVLALRMLTDIFSR